MKKIPLTQSQYTTVDDNDYRWLSQWKWCVKLSNGGYYAARGVWNSKTKKTELIKMHRLILGLKRKDGKIADHVNHNTLDNRRHNLRVVTPSQNQMNRRKVVGFRWCKPRKKWVAYIMLNYKSIHLGYFLTKKKAEQAYLEAKKVYHKIA